MTDTTNKSKWLANALLILVLVATVWTEAQAKTVIRRVRFQPGRTTAVLRERITADTHVVYVLRASAGQTMSVHIPGSSGVNIQSIEGPGGAVLFDDPGPDWTGELPRSGDYRIRVGMFVESDSARYTIEVVIR